VREQLGDADGALGRGRARARGQGVGEGGKISCVPGLVCAALWCLGSASQLLQLAGARPRPHRHRPQPHRQRRTLHAADRRAPLPARERTLNPHAAPAASSHPAISCCTADAISWACVPASGPTGPPRRSVAPSPPRSSSGSSTAAASTDDVPAAAHPNWGWGCEVAQASARVASKGRAGRTHNNVRAMPARRRRPRASDRLRSFRAPAHAQGAAAAPQAQRGAVGSRACVASAVVGKEQVRQQKVS
jgi:hypothetical protein